jgi:ribosome biogenesis GTPase
MLDFVRFDFFGKDDLPYTFPEIEAELGGCRYTKCTHTKEEGCAIMAAKAAGKIPESRHESFRALYDILKNKHDWDKKS